MLIRKYIIHENPDYFSSFSTKSFEGLKTNYYDSTIKQRYEGDTDLFIVLVTLDSSQIVEEYFRETILEILGYTGALFRVIILLFSLYLYSFNKEEFYTKYKNWDNLP